MTSENNEKASRPSATGEPPRHRVSTLMNGGRLAILEHDGEDYLLRLTSRGRLLLTK